MTKNSFQDQPKITKNWKEFSSKTTCKNSSEKLVKTQFGIDQNCIQKSSKNPSKIDQQLNQNWFKIDQKLSEVSQKPISTWTKNEFKIDLKSNRKQN